MPLAWLTEARRFRPGLDYTLATSEEKEARLDVVLGLTPEPRPLKDGSNAPRGWQTAEWGGWEVCVLFFFIYIYIYILKRILATIENSIELITSNASPEKELISFFV